MFKSLTLKNFRSYENEKLVFHKGLNAIIGEGMAGKTNILRAIKRLRYFRPVNLKFFSTFANKKDISELILKTDDGYIVNLTQGLKSKPIYTLTNTNGRKQVFRKINKTVPSEVKRAININDINLQFQLDQPYIVSSSAGQVTKIINDITKISTVDKWIKRINKNIKSYQIILNDSLSELKEVNNELDGLKNLEKLEPIIKELLKIKKEISSEEERYYKIESLIAEIKDANNILNKLKRVLKSEKFLKSAKKIRKKIDMEEEKQDVIIDLLDLKNGLSGLKKELKAKIKKYIKKIKNSKTCPTCFSKITNKTITQIRNNLK